MIKFLQRFISNPKEFAQRISLKYAYKVIPDFLNFRYLRGFYNSKYYKAFYEKFDDYCFVVPLGIPYNYMKQRPQHIATHMSKYFSTFYYTGVLFVNDDKVRGIDKIKEDFSLINDGINGNSIFDVKKKIIYTYWPIDHFFYVKADTESFVIYDCLDEIDISPRFNNNTIEKHNFMLKRANLILASSDELYGKIPDRYKHKSLLITNGVDVEHFNLDYKKSRTVKKEYTVCFYGALEKWIDIEIIEKIAKENNFRVKLIGPIVDPIFNRLQDNKNIELLGHQSYSDLPLLVKDIDIFILPFRVNDLTKSVSPVKLFEHFATGKPVVSTALPECMKYETVFIADINDFIMKIDEAIKFIDDDKYIESSYNYAQDNSWDSKIKKIVEKIKILNAKKDK